MSKFAVRYLKNMFYPVNIPNSFTPKCGDMVLLRTEKGEEALKTEEKLIQKQSIKSGPVYKIKDDPRITKFGKFIRRWSLDELPQFMNVLKKAI